MASNQTANYQLNQWEPEDKVLRTDFNADNLKIDGALGTLAQGLQECNEVIAKLGNCIFYTTSYTGSGSFGNRNAEPNSLAFPHAPYLVAISDPEGPYMLMFRSAGKALSILHPQYAHLCEVSWSERTVSWYTTAGLATSQMNAQGVSYQVLALLAADE